MIIFPDEQNQSSEQNDLKELVNSTGIISQSMGMISQRLDLNTAQRILINDGSYDRIIVGYGAGLF